MEDGQWLVFGATAGVGRQVLDRLADRRVVAHAISRVGAAANHGAPGVQWHRGDLESLDPAGLPSVQAIVSAGPLDAFARLAARARWPAGTSVAVLSSMSAATKAQAGHRAEREVSARLRAAEESLLERSAEQEWRLVILRPTLIWGAGDRSISPLLALARRLGWLALPRGATGIRQPVHAADLAAALVACVDARHMTAGPWPAAGAERLGFDRMIERALRVAVPDARLVRLPDWPFRLLEPLAARLPGRAGLLASQLARARTDLGVEHGVVWERLGITPRGFDPDPSSFTAGID